jgi:hypothetical protein
MLKTQICCRYLFGWRCFLFVFCLVFVCYLLSVRDGTLKIMFATELFD